MIEFLSRYTVDEFIVFCSSLCLLVVSAIKSFDWLNQRFDLFETKSTKTQRKLDELTKNVSLLLEQNGSQEKALKTILDSDKCRIRAELTRIWQEHRQEEKIDYFTLTYAQKQFECYRAEGGNTYVCGIMDEMQSWEITK